MDQPFDRSRYTTKEAKAGSSSHGDDRRLSIRLIGRRSGAALGRSHRSGMGLTLPSSTSLGTASGIPVRRSRERSGDVIPRPTATNCVFTAREFAGCRLQRPAPP